VFAGAPLNSEPLIMREWTERVGNSFQEDGDELSLCYGRDSGLLMGSVRERFMSRRNACQPHLVPNRFRLDLVVRHRKGMSVEMGRPEEELAAMSAVPFAVA